MIERSNGKRAAVSQAVSDRNNSLCIRWLEETAGSGNGEVEVGMEVGWSLPRWTHTLNPAGPLRSLLYADEGDSKCDRPVRRKHGCFIIAAGLIRGGYQASR